MAIRFSVFWLVAVLVLVGAADPARSTGDRNHMAETASPYLHLHATDPVHWRPWNSDTLAEAKRLGKPILLSIGYLSCHWCHVMQRESFANEATARLINDNFLPVLIDREEMPDLDSTFQSAAALMGVPGGWPLTMFLTSDGKPFFGGAYFPPRETGGMASFTHVLGQVIEIHRTSREDLVSEASEISRILALRSRPVSGSVTMAQIDTTARSLLGQVNSFTGGFGEAPMFPMTVAQNLLWRGFLRTGETDYRDAVTMTLNAMVRGGIYDHLGGGFFRYTIDPAWSIPHFEKMLDVNAALLHLMTDVWRETRDPLLARAIRETVVFLRREMRLDGGAFASALDADSASAITREEEEGAFYLWDRSAIEKILGDRAEYFLDHHTLIEIEEATGDVGHLYFGRETGTTEDQDMVRDRLALFSERAKRSRPRRDDKILVDWNAMAIMALAEAAMAFNEPSWLNMAETAFHFIERNLVDNSGGLHHSWYQGAMGELAALDDFGGLASAALTLFEATGKRTYIEAANRWANDAIRLLWDDQLGAFLATQKDAAPQLIRATPIYDSPNMSGNARMIDTLARLFYLGGANKNQEYAERVRKSFGGEVVDPSFGIAGYLNAIETLDTALQVVIIGKRGETATKKLVDTVLGSSLPTRTFQVVGPETELPEGHPARYKVMIDESPTVYVCKGSFCSLPAITADELSETLTLMRRGE